MSLSPSIESVVYTKDELHTDAELYLKNTMTKWNMWNRDFEFDATNDSLSKTASQVREHSKYLRSLYFSKCCLEMERNRWGYDNSSAKNNDFISQKSNDSAGLVELKSQIGVQLAGSQNQPVTIDQFLRSLPLAVSVIDRANASTVKDTATKQLRKYV